MEKLNGPRIGVLIDDLVMIPTQQDQIRIPVPVFTIELAHAAWSAFAVRDDMAIIADQDVL